MAYTITINKTVLKAGINTSINFLSLLFVYVFSFTVVLNTEDVVLIIDVLYDEYQL